MNLGNEVMNFMIRNPTFCSQFISKIRWLIKRQEYATVVIPLEIISKDCLEPYKLIHLLETNVMDSIIVLYQMHECMIGVSRDHIRDLG